MLLPDPDEYNAQLRKRRVNRPVVADPLADELAKERNREIREGLFLSASPDTIARVNRVSRVTGEPPVLVEDRVDAYEKSITSDRFMGVVQEHPSIAKWAVNNPRGAAAAVDDWDSLSMLGKAWQGIKNVGSSLKVGFAGAGGMAADSLDAVRELTDTILYPLDAAIATGVNAYSGAVGSDFRLDPDKSRQTARNATVARRADNEAYKQAERPDVDNWLAKNLLSGVENIPLTLTAVATRNPTAGTAVVGGVVGGSEYQAGRDAGLSPARSAVYGATQGTIEAITEKIPISRLLSDIGQKSPIGKTLINQLVAELPGEQVATFLQDMTEWGTLNPDKTLSEFIAERPSAAAETFVQTLGAVGTTVGATKAAERTIQATIKISDRVSESRRAKKEAGFLDEVMKASEKSKLRERDPEAFKEMLKGMAADNDTPNIYVSGEALQEYMQSDAYDPEGPLAAWVQQVEEAAATGGDVLMPIEEAAVALQPAWATLKDDVRLSAGGVSRREAQTFDEAMADVMDELATAMSEQDKATAKKLEPIERLATSINQKLQNAGFTPSTAKVQADLLVQRYATRAERLGKQLTGNEFDVTVNNVLPEGLAAARNADNLDLVINSYFTMKNPKEQTGKSLIEWIAERGGVTDDGGDLKSMGLDKWHVGKFKKKALKKSTKGQGNMLGVSDSNYQPDRVLVSAIEAGYFPELDGSTELVDANVLLEAIGEELRGVPRYAQERIVDDVQQLAMQLDEYLGQAGFDTSNMTRDEMRSAIMQAQDAQLGGYTQATITIDGVERPTQNSNGQPLAQTEEGLRNFYAWFKDSKVVDAEGRPLVVYHATSADFDAFKTNWRGAMYFAFTSDGAMAGARGGSSDRGSGSPNQVMPVYLRASRIDGLNYSSEQEAALAEYADTYTEADWFKIEAKAKADGVDRFFVGEGNSAESWQIIKHNPRSLQETIQSGVRATAPLGGRSDAIGGYPTQNEAAFVESQKARGFDGYLVTDEGGISLAVFSPEQIKSVNNRGTFDPADVRILFQSASPQDSEAFKAWAGTDAPVIEPEEINDFDFTGEGPFVVRAFHGTTHEFEAFDASVKGTKEGQFGAVNYFTSSRDDAEGNYAGEGPDLTLRIETRAERIEGESDGEIDMDTARQMAREELAGATPQTLEVFVRTEKPFIVGTDDSPWIEFTDFDALERRAVEQVAENEGVDVSEVEANRDDYEDAIDEARWEIEGETPNALYEAVEAVALRYDLDAQEIYGQLAGTANEGATQSDLENIFRQAEALQYVEDPETGDLISFHVIGEIISELGFDSIILKNAETRFAQMNMGQGTAHIHVFDKHNSNIKSVNNRGTFDASDPRILFQSAFHGSPHIFDKFSLDKIGTGEGAQAYGWGLYFAGRKEIAEHYRNTLTLNIGFDYGGRTGLNRADVQNLASMKYGGRYFDNIARASGVADKVMDDLIYGGSNKYPDGSERSAIYDEIAAELKRPDNAGRTYTVDIPEDSEYLLWDAPLSEQPGDVWDRLIDAVQRNMGEPMGEELAAMFEDGDIVGKDAYNWVVATFEKGEVPDGVFGLQLTNGKAAQMASEIMREAGIAGIKYLDGGSRAAGDGSYNYVVFDDSRVSIKAYEQSYEDNARGKITFNSGQATIDLFKTRNLSTFLHEVGHLWLEELRFDAELADAPAELKADWETVNKWFASQGYGSTDGVITTEAHEMWARGVERYLMEGKSPVPALKRIFETFRVWLTSIYKTVDALKSPITPEIRAVMDRLIATDDQLNDMVERQGIEALFKDAAEAGMTGAEFAAYVDQTQAARNEASGKMLDKTMRSIRAREQKRYKEAEATVREEISAEVDARPMFKALRLLKTGPMDDAWIRSEFGEDSVRLLPSRVPPVYKTGGIHPDIIAEQSGFDTGKQMVEALMGAELAHRQAKEGGDTRSMRERTISNEVDAVMQARYGDPLNDGSIEREALEAVHNDMQGDVIAAEIRVLARRTGKRPTPYAIAKDWARNKIRSGAVVDEASPSAIQRYARAAAKSASLAQEAMLKQDVDAAFKHKQAQMLNNALVSEAKAALDDVSSAVKRLEKIAKRKTMKSVDQEYLEQAQALLENVDMRRRSQVSVTRQGKFEAWANERQAEGHDVPVPPSFEATLGRTNWTRLSVENLLGLDEAVKHIIHLGRFKQTLLDNQERREFDELVGEAEQGAGNLRQKPPSDLMAPSYWDGVKSKILAADAALLKMETVFDWLDGGNSNGVFNRVVFRPIADAQENERKMLEETIGNLTDALSAVPNETLKRWGDKVETSLINRETGRPFVFTRDALVSIALNVGNQSNLDKLTGGYNWQEGEVMSVLANELTQEEWTYVQSVWDTIESLWPQIEAMEKRINGVAPDKIVAQPVETPFGTLKGGYFPVVYDPRRNYDAEANAAKNSNIFEAIYTRASTPKGFTKERTAVERPIHLSLGIINRHVSEVIHDLTHREAIMQADKFLSNKRIMKAVDDTLGPEVRKLFRPWLQRIANEWAYDRAGNAGWEKFFKKLRLNATIVGMGFRASTVLMQAAGYSNSFERVGARWVAPRMKDAFNPSAYRFVLDKSKEVAARMDNLDRDMRDNVKAAMGKTDWLTAPKRFAFHGIAYMDRMVVIPTWLGAYDKAIAGGMTDDDAIYAADKAVRQSQGSGAAKDLAAVQTGRGPAGEALKLLTMFYSYMSAFYQRQRNLGRDVRNASAGDFPALLARAWWLLIVPPVLSEILADRGPDDDEDWAAWAFEKIAFSMLGPIPLVRDAAPVLYAKATDKPTFGYRFTPAVGLFESSERMAGDLGNLVEGEETKRATRTAIETVGYFTGLTTGQMATAAQFLVDVSYEEQDPETVKDWYDGLTTGKIKEKE